MSKNKNNGVYRAKSVYSKKDFYFVFGQIHETVDGVPMKDRWVRVRAKNDVIATEIFRNEFTSKYMPSVESWSRIIPNLYLDYREVFSLGEYMSFEQKYSM
jgi:hypothetical protein